MVGKTKQNEQEMKNHREHCEEKKEFVSIFYLNSCISFLRSKKRILQEFWVGLRDGGLRIKKKGLE